MCSVPNPGPVLRNSAVSARHGSRTSRVGTVAALFLLIASTFAGSAAGQEPLPDLEARMESIQGDFRATSNAIEKLRGRIEDLRKELARAQARTVLQERRPEASMGESSFPVEEPSSSHAAIDALRIELAAHEADLERVRRRLAAANERLQKHFQSRASEYQRLRRRAAEPVRPGADGSGELPVRWKPGADMPCPVAGEVSFTDSWGDPRSGGRSHQGTDMMADYGTPLVAIASGVATYVAYDEAGGYMIMLDGDDGNLYYYVHNQENLVSQGQRVEVGEKIATVGDTGNAAGTPHLHFEFHPGGGEAVNPYPLVSGLC